MNSHGISPNFENCNCSNPENPNKKEQLFMDEKSRRQGSNRVPRILAHTKVHVNRLVYQNQHFRLSIWVGLCPM